MSIAARRTWRSSPSLESTSLLRWTGSSTGIFNVFIFSDNVSVDVEVALKSRARERGLLVMGPDCGTGSIGGLPLGFANVVHAGKIGLVGASGTGLQEVMVQIDRLGGGVSHAIGLGGRDLSAEVGGITCLQALRALAADAATDVSRTDQ